MDPPPRPDPGRAAFPAGTVTAAAASGDPSARALPNPGPPASGTPWSGVITSGSDRRRPTLLWFGLAAAALVAGGIALVLVLAAGGSLGSGGGPLAPAPPPDVRPPLARLCPAPTAPAERSSAASLPEPSRPRTVDETAGISYRAYGAPWEAWPFLWRMGTLEVPYGVGQHFITETYPGGTYHASILSGAVPATDNDSTAIDLECTGRQVAADVRAEYYPQPNTIDLMRDEPTTLGGLPAWVTTFRLHFDEEGLSAKSELVGVALIDVGRPTAAVLYVSVPGTHPQWDHVVDEVLGSVRPA